MTNSSGADQRPDAHKNEETRPDHEQGKENSHQNLDSKDEKSLKVRARFPFPTLRFLN